ncbi:MAG: hypothetical protein IPP15_22580 [Saprospiraceae bacterium]|uniref:Gliding motility-associated C-terminal domain-containing protein n=1 Tax=Candidatus Opimibacter skivensis TaxID=2982028 RepID=A0A9D7XVX2_9BACT|nr:hypothetical protein [Candidatus Opimibacter skivensis]
MITTGTIASCYLTVAEAEAAALLATTEIDDCPGVITETATTVGTCSAVVTVTETDGCGNVSSTTYTTRIDNTAPVITTGTIASCYPTVAEAEAAALLATTEIDDCPGVITETASTVGTCSAVVTVTETDGCGNVSSTTYATRIDNTAPVITTGTIASCYPTVAEAEAAALLATTEIDDCPGVITETASTVGTCSAVVTVTETDGCGNVSSTTYATRIDNTAPVITTGTIASCYPTVAEAEAAALLATTEIDDCPGVITETASTVGTCSAVVTVTETDGCGNVSSTTYATRIDNTAPVITTGTIASCYLTVAEAEAAALLATTEIDDCPGVITETASTVGTCSAVVTVTETDGCGNVSSTTYATRIDNTAPVITTGTIASCYLTVAEAEAAALLATTEIDDCPGVITETASTVGTCSAVVTVTETDGCGNVSSTTYATRIDNTAPVVTTTAGSLDVALECSDVAGMAAALAATPSATDNCTLVPTLVLVSDILTNDPVCTSAYVRVRIWNFTDGCDNTSANFTQTITVTDVTAPVAITPVGGLDVTLQCSDASGLAAALALAPTASDNCSTVAVSLVSNFATPDLTCANAYVRIREWVFVDECFNFSNFTQTITVIDDTAPVITTPAESLDATVVCSDGAGLTTALALFPAATDNCTMTPTMVLVSDITTPDGVCPNGYVRIRVWNFTDGCGNTSADFMQSISVIDNIAPVVTTPAGSLDANLECSDAAALAAAVAAVPTATDNCTGTPTMVPVSDITTPDGACPNGYVRVRVWNFTDGCGNTSADFTQVITVIDNIAPVVTTPAGSLDATVECSDPLGLATALAAAPTATDNCTADPALTLVSNVTTPGLCPNAYTQVRVWTFNDGCGNTSAPFTQTITVQDVTAPVLSGEGLAATIDCPALPVFTAPTAADACDGAPVITFTDATVAGACAGAYATTRTWVATDACGNTSLAVSQTITVQDVTAPVLSGEGLAATIDCPALPVFTAPTAADACDGLPVITFTDATVAGACAGAYATTRTWVATDACGNTSLAVSQTITVQDVTAPVLSGEGLAATIDCPALPVFTAPTAADACDGAPVITFTDSTIPGACAGAYATTRTWVATDACGNTSLAVSQTITVQDVTAPVLSGEGLATTIDCPALPVFTAPTAADACDGAPVITFTDATVAGACAGAYATTRTWVATDACGNTSLAVSQTITVQDVTAPVLSGEGLAATIDCPALPVFTAPTAADACDGAPVITFTDVTVAGACFQTYTTTRTWLATDACGNISLPVSQTITVQDITPPVLSGEGLAATIDCPALPVIAAPPPVDACDISPVITFTDVTVAGACAGAYATTRTWVATDACGNTSLAVSQTITVQDVTAPVLSGEGLATTIDCPALPVFTAPTAADACDGAPVITFTDVTVAGACFQAYATTRTWLATDACGNTSLPVSQTITVQDVTAPVLSGEGLAATIDCPAIPAFGAPTAVDACDIFPLITFTDVTVPGACAGAYATTRTWVATDACGNTSLAVSQTITVQDVTAPVLSGEGLAATIDCPALPVFTAPTAADACDGAPVITFTDVTVAGACFQAYSTTRTWLATDACGNTSLPVSQTITVQDVTAPVLSGEGLAETIDCPAIPAFGAPTAVDACDIFPLITFTDVTVPGACAGAYATTRTWVATDACGNTSLAVSQTITVQDVTAPVLSGEGLATTIDCPALPVFTAPTAADACDGAPVITFTDVTVAGACFQAYSTTRTWLATDACGNTSLPVSQTITIQDITPPVLSGEGPAATIDCPAIPAFGAPTAVDACDIFPFITFTDVTVPGMCRSLCNYKNMGSNRCMWKYFTCSKSNHNCTRCYCTCIIR